MGENADPCGRGVPSDWCPVRADKHRPVEEAAMRRGAAWGSDVREANEGLWQRVVRVSGPSEWWGSGLSPRFALW
jgi:hypothetical protein